MNKIFIIGGAALVALVLVFGGRGTSTSISGVKTGSLPDTSAAKMDGGKQVITIAVGRGYTPGNIEAKGGVPTVLSFVTNGTYDCSSALVIPALGVKEQLKPVGKFDVTLDPKSGDILKGSCAMGMYDFKIAFK